MRIEGALHFTHDAHLGGAGELRQKRFLGDANPVFAGDGAAETNGLSKDFFECCFNTMHLCSITFVGEKSRVKISVTQVAKRADAELIFLGNCFDEPDHRR